MIRLDYFIHRKLVVLHSSGTIQQAARAMCDNKIGCVIIVDRHSNLVGIVTDRDLTCYPLAFGIQGSEPLANVMTEDPVVVYEGTQLNRVVQLMIENGIRRLPIIERTDVDGPASGTSRRASTKHRKCIGLVTLDDLIEAKAISLEDLARVVQSQMLRRQFNHIYENGDEREFGNEERIVQKANRFYNVIAEKTGLSRKRAEEAVWIYLSQIVGRLTSKEATNFISQLPRQLQERLLPLSRGPNRGITAGSILETLGGSLSLGVPETQAVVIGITVALDDLIGQGEMSHVRSQLPEKMRMLFHGAGKHNFIKLPGEALYKKLFTRESV